MALGCHPVGPPLFWSLPGPLGGPWDPRVLPFSGRSLHFQTPETPGSSQELGRHPTEQETVVYLVWASPSQSLPSRDRGPAGGALPTAGVQNKGLQVETGGECEGTPLPGLSQAPLITDQTLEDACIVHLVVPTTAPVHTTALQGRNHPSDSTQ